MHTIAAKAVCFGEALQPEFKVYARQVVKNAAALAEALQEHGFKLVTGGTSNHMMLINIYGSFGIDGHEAETAFDAIGLTMNKNVIADDPLPAFRPSGIRLGTPAVTTKGLKEKDMERIAAWMKQAINHRGDRNRLEEIHQEVEAFSLQFPLPSDQ
jgi:glycine hydroxymethyltransferase